MMTYLNQVETSTVNEWMNNFENQQGNIYKYFQDNEVVLRKEIYDLVSNNNQFHIHMYFGLKADDTPCIIVTGAYQLDDYDGPDFNPSEENGYADVLDPNKIVELYSGNVININDAKDYVQNWVETNQNNVLFKKSFLIPRPNMIKFFLEDQVQEVLIFFGLDSNEGVKVMERELNSTPNDLVLDKARPCPNMCAKVGL
jgi:hypothetical protein